MQETIDISAIYDKSLNFLIGSGASAGLFPTLALRIRDEFEVPHTLETLATELDKTGQEDRLAWLFLHYYATCIRPAMIFKEDGATTDAERKVLVNYETFLRTVIQILQRRRTLDRRCNVFTTNYDGCLADAADRILSSGSDNFTLNDGAIGFRRRYVHAQNFSTFLCQSGVFERSLTGIPQINLIHLHGSVFWKKANAGIEVDYQVSQDDLIPPNLRAALDDAARVLLDGSAHTSDFAPDPMAPDLKSRFLEGYRMLPIISPTKWKFQETVFEEHYYQMLRLLSYELEKPGAVLITFGFSFADEHILNLVRRSLANPQLQVFVCCYSAEEQDRLEKVFKQYPNVKCVGPEEGKLDFDAFNEFVFTTRGFASSPSTATRSGASEAQDGDAQAVPETASATASGGARK